MRESKRAEPEFSGVVSVSERVIARCSTAASLYAVNRTEKLHNATGKREKSTKKRIMQKNCFRKKSNEFVEAVRVWHNMDIEISF